MNRAPLLVCLAALAFAQAPPAPKSMPAFKPATASQLKAQFANPPAEYRSMPLWVWNDELSWPRLQQQLAQYKKQGMGGVFVHPRPGLMTEYLGAEWFRQWGLSIAEGKRLGLLVNIYDENSYPSGFAGGIVPSAAPDTAVQYVTVERDVPRDAVRWHEAELVSVFASPDGQRIMRREQMPKDAKAIVFKLRRASGNPWTADFPYVDLTNPETARKFIELGLEPYKKRFSLDFGKTVKWVFDDEPLLATGGAYDPSSMALPLSRNTLAEFHKRCGYALEDSLPSLFWDVGDFRKVRFDYWQTLHDLWKENYLQPLYQWCDRNSLQFTGHWMEHEWPFPWITPADMSLYAFEHMPGIDMLEGTQLRLHGNDPHMLFTIKQVASASAQLGRRSFCEAYGVAGWDSTFEHYKRFGDWLQVHGIDFINQHLSFSTVRGARKRDHPQSFSDVSAWWPHYRLHGDHVGRLSSAIAQSESRNRVLVLLPTTSGFLYARRGAATPELSRMRAENASFIQFLADNQADFDLGDEYLMEWFGKAEGGNLRVGRMTYEALLWPANMENVRSQTVPLLEAYLASGGTVVAIGGPAPYVDGRPSEAVKSLRTKFASQWIEASSHETALSKLRGLVAARVELSAPQKNVGMAERFLAGGERVVIFANSGLDRKSFTAAVKGASAEEWDTVNGRIAPALFTSHGDRVTIDVALEPAGSRVFVVSEKAAAPSKPANLEWRELAGRSWTVTMDALNVVALDYCDVTIAGRQKKDINTWQANWEIWQAHGFDRPAWDNAVQFKRRVYDRNKFGKDSGFTARFEFEVAEETIRESLELALEAPELYKITLNGKPLSFAASKPWMDPHIRRIPIGSFARNAMNELVVEGRPFDVRMELENVYVLGKFRAVAQEKGFRLMGPRGLGFGSWSKQGMPFYSDAVTYSTEVDVPASGRIRVDLGKFEGSVVQVLLDGKEAAVMGWMPWSAEFPAPQGKHQIAVRVVSTPRNIFGPFHNPAKLRMRAWPAAWAEFPEHQPEGKSYDVLEYGLLEAPRVSVSK